MQLRWVMAEADEASVEQLRRELGIPAPVARVLVNRGVEEVSQAERFLSPSLKGLHAPEGLADMDRAVHRILLALETRERIWVYGDYDADGVTSVALLTSFLESAGVKVNWVIPNRERDGYGFHCCLIPETCDRGGLVITADCGISDHEEVEKARARGLDVVVTDHHEVPESLPRAYAVVNPKRADNLYPFGELAGVGVAFMLAWALARRLKERRIWPPGKEPSLKTYLDLVALGTIADQAPLLGENRTLVRHGLAQMAQGHRPGIQALMRAAALENRPVSVGSLTFQLAPRMNAPGRLDEASPALELLLTKDSATATELAALLDGMNRKRQQIEDEVLREAEARAWDAVRGGDSALVLAREGWHPGVLGIVASRLVDRFGLPVVLVSLRDGMGKGSARAPEGYHLMEGLRSCGHLLQRFGGHRMAAGLKVEAGALEEFRQCLCAHAREALGERRGARVLRIDDRLAPGDITEELVRSLQKLEPHGTGNPEPVFQVDGVEISGCRRVGQAHLKLSLSHGSRVFDAIGFGMAEALPQDARGQARLACLPQLNDWQGRTSIQLKLKDLRLL
jgi:single-stranded-DNA-specific exonuclease